MKSDDLQGLRGIAVISVVAYHLKICFVQYGFLGVDVFFVLSGYFMARTMHGKQVNLENAIEFYQRRLKRLLPSFALLVFLVALVMPFFFILNELDVAAEEIVQAMLFLVNIKFASDIGSYFTKGFTSAVMHLWSISVEMQFYLFVPLIYIAVNKMKTREYRIASFSCLLVASVVSSLFTQPSHSFYYLQNRLWEFMVGFLVQEAEEELREMEVDMKWKNMRTFGPVSMTSTIILLWIMNSGSIIEQSTLNDLVYRIATLMCTSLIILSASFSRNRILGMNWLVYTGDISYVLYLIHWPVIVFAYSWVLIDFDNAVRHEFYDIVVLVCLAVSMFLSILIHHAFERPLLKKRFKICLSISMVFYILTLLALTFRQNVADRIVRFRQDGNSTLYNLMEWNHRRVRHCCNTIPEDCAYDPEVWKWIDREEEKRPDFALYICTARSNGNLTVLVLGNSVSSSSFETVHRSLDGRYSTLRLFTKYGCSILAGRCDEYWSKVKVVVEKMNPDIIMITEYGGYMNERKDDPTILRVAQQRLDYLRAYSKVVMADTDYLIAQDISHTYAISHLLARGFKNMTVIRRPPLKDLHKSQRTSHDRMNALRGVILNNITFALCQREQGVCEGYNPITLQSYTELGIHLNAYGYRLLEPIYKRSIDRVIDIASNR